MNGFDAQSYGLVPVANQLPAMLSDDELAQQLIGRAIDNRYHLISLIGKGGMGAVYKARHIQLNKTVAVKILWPQLAYNPSAMRRFKQEAKATSGLEHPGLVSVYDYGLTDFGAPYLVMQYASGRSLADVLNEDGRLTPSRALAISIQLCDALAHAHANGVIHRDLKPSNMILSHKRDDNECVQIVDFGIAKLLSEMRDEGLTLSGEVFGSPLYMSPEQCVADYVDHRSDIYSLGCVMYEMFSGDPPFDGGYAMQTMYKQVNDRPSFEHFKRLGVPVTIESIIDRMLEKRKEDRYRSMDELKRDLLGALDKGHPRFRQSATWFWRRMPVRRMMMYACSFFFGCWIGVTLALWSEVNQIIRMPFLFGRNAVAPGAVTMQSTTKTLRANGNQIRVSRK